MSRYYTLFTFLLLSVALHAQRFVAEAPSQVSVGEQFRVTYTVNTQNANGFRVGSFPDAFEVLMGPSTSVQSSYQMVNGHTSSSSSVTYTYILSADKNGSFKIPAAHVTVGGRTISSNIVHVRVSGQSRGNSGSAQQQSGSPQQQMRAAGSHISGRDLFIKVSANKSRVHEQEPVLLTYKVYTLVDLTQLEGKMPDLKGFHTQEVQLPQQKSFRIERYKGLPYRTVTWSQYVMFPQITGKLTIPSITFNGIVVQENRSVDPFEAFFNGGSGYVEVKKQIKAPGLTIQVDPLPKRPSNFSGGVGHFNISAQPNKTETRANDPITLRVIVSGIGNLKLIKEPVVNFPKDFDKYDAKVTDKTKLTSNGVEGSMIYDFLAVPRHQGTFVIPPVTFTYYDTEANAYKTISASGFKLNVSKGSGNSSVSDYTGQEDVQDLNSDIRYIKLGDAKVHAIDDIYFDSLAYWITLALLALIFVSLLVIFRQRAIDNANVGKMRGKKANKVATRRLKKASKLMFAGKPGEFYDEVLRALWGYVGDKLNMRIEQLSRDNISQKLAQHDVDEATVGLFIQALDECEFERYAPGDEKGNMSKTFNAAMTAIMKIEETMRKHKKPASVKLGMIVLFLLLLPLSSHAITKENADSAYARQQYQQAIKDYQELLRSGVSADLYYNLGNSYYRMDNITRAVLNYERALLLAPGDRDIRFNLQLARSKTIDKITPESEMFFVTWYHSLVNMMDVDGWAITSLASLALGIVLVLIYLFANRIWLRKFGFFGGGFVVILFVLSTVFAYQQRALLMKRDGAIVVSSAVQIKSTPAKNGTDLFILHEGTKVTIVDGTMKNWKKVIVADGKEGWLETANIEII
jgi:tetratricopeptide (TPR) repeat protein